MHVKETIERMEVTMQTNFSSKQSVFTGKVKDMSEGALLVIATHQDNYVDLLDENNAALLSSFTTKITSAETTGIQKHINKWTTLGNEMKKSHAKLVNTNSIAIRNNNSLLSQLTSSTKQINDLKDTIAINEATISTMAVDVKAITAQISTMKEQVSKDYLPTVKTEVSSIISSLLREKCSAQATTDMAPTSRTPRRTLYVNST